MENSHFGPHEICGVFITGTGTDVGKTIVTGALLRAIHDQGIDCCAMKPLQTGISGANAVKDASIYQQFAPETRVDTLFTFPLPASPALAANHAGECLQICDLVNAIYDWVAESGKRFLILEGAGGIHVPINDRCDMLVLMQALGLPCLLVTDNQLGSVNRTTLSLNALVSAGLQIAGVVLNDARPAITPEQRLIMSDNASTIARAVAHLPGNPPFVRLPYITYLDQRGREVLVKLLNPIATALAAWKCTRHNLMERDAAILWHPYESAQNPSPVEEAESTRGNYIFLRDGRKLIDGMSSWWAAIHGYRHPALMQALAAQAAKMPHVMFGGFTHEPAVGLAERLLRVLPSGIKRLFFSDSGSVAVEIGLKMALQYHVANGESHRKKFLTIAGGYHGDTFGAMSVCDPVTGMHSLFSGYLPQQLFLPRPRSSFKGKLDQTELEYAEKLVAENAHELAALILEPVVQGAGGMWFYHPGYLDGLANICRKYGLLLIYDEIATGFGRTGKYFATQWTKTVPDIICVGKALTGGVMPLAATGCAEKITRTLGTMPLMHGPTFMANPLACAVACASLDILAQNRWPAQVATLEKSLIAGLAPCRTMAGVANVRVLGAIGVVEMQKDVDTRELNRFFVSRGVWIRPFKNLVYLMPPYISPLEDIGRLCATVRDAIQSGIWKK